MTSTYVPDLTGPISLVVDGGTSSRKAVGQPLDGLSRGPVSEAHPLKTAAQLRRELKALSGRELPANVPVELLERIYDAELRAIMQPGEDYELEASIKAVERMYGRAA